MYDKKFADRLSELRIEKGVSARDMSLSLGQNSGYINHIENGQTLPSMTAFFNICEYFSITPQQFFAFDQSSPALSNELISNLSNLTREELECLRVIIHALSSSHKPPSR